MKNKKNITANEFYKILKIAGHNNIVKIIKNKNNNNFNVFDFKTNERGTKLRIIKNIDNTITIKLYKNYNILNINFNNNNFRDLLINYIDLNGLKLREL
jgi:hypothetical protein